MPVCLLERRGGAITRAPLSGMLSLPGREISKSKQDPADAEQLSLMPVRPVGDAVAAALVPRGLAGKAELNGNPLPEGIHALRHTDRLSLGEQHFWIAVHPAVDEVDFSREVHGSDAYCFLTKARLGVGDRVVVCPGRPGVPCGAIYKADAWELAMRPDSGLKCLNCGFHPSQALWEPPRPRERIELDALYQLASCR